MSPSTRLPDDLAGNLQRAKGLEYWTLFWLTTITLTMYLVMGSSQAMKTAWVEDFLSLVPAALFLIAAYLEEKPPTRHYPYGFYRFASLAFFGAALLLLSVGLYLLLEAGLTLFGQEHPSIGTFRLFGEEIWLGWAMIAALLYSVIPPVVLGRMKKPLAHEINDKVLFTDAAMNAADWQTGLAGIAGIIGIAFGLWWADAAAAALISISIVFDGLKNTRMAFAELIDGAPRKIDSPEISDAAQDLCDRLRRDFPDTYVQVRETGRYMRANVTREDRIPEPLAVRYLPDEPWRLLEISRSIEEDAAGNSPGTGASDRRSGGE